MSGQFRLKHCVLSICTTLLAIPLFNSCSSAETGKTIYEIRDGKICRNGAPVYYIGTNAWYLAPLAISEPERLDRELDSLKSLGVWNVRMMATELSDTTAIATVLDKLDERDMAAVLFLNNSWEWTKTTYASYLEAAGAGRQPHPSRDGYAAYVEAMAKFAQNDRAVALYHDHVRKMVSCLKDAPAIFSWQICNEPRPFDGGAADAFYEYIASTARLIKSIDPAHMVSTGSEGSVGCGFDTDLARRIHSIPEIDYYTIHIWPYNWGWIGQSDEDKAGYGEESALKAIRFTEDYLRTDTGLAYDCRKPVVIEEFGFPRDGYRWQNDSTTAGRDRYYEYIFSRVLKDAREGGRIQGCNFWAWSGTARQGHQFWQEGDDLCGDPFQEAQGLNGVYLSDSSTVSIIRSYADTLVNMPVVWAPVEHDLLYDGSRNLRIMVAAPESKDIDGLVLDLAVVADTSLMSPVQDTVLHISRTVSVKHGRTAETSFDISPLAPGFYQIRLGSLRYNIGVRPEEISSPLSRKEDFEDFWKGTLEELAKVPVNARMTRIAEYSNDVRTTYNVTLDSFGGDVCGGIITIPNKEGRYPVSISYMGYGADVYYNDPSAAPERIDFLVSVRNQGLFKDGGRWCDRGLDSKENYYYRGAFCDVVRAVDFVCTLDKADTTRMFAWGDSQGGAFTWISAALDHRMRAIAPSVPFLGDFEDYHRIVWWPMHEIFDAAAGEGLSREHVLDMMTYFDVKNFTPYVECPVYMAFGMQDPTCPPHTNFAEYNNCGSADRRYMCVPACGHDMWREQAWSAARESFFNEFMQ